MKPSTVRFMLARTLCWECASLEKAECI